MNRKRRVTVLGGAGMMGTVLAQQLAQRNFLEVILYDRDDRGEGRAGDVRESAPVLGFYPTIRGTSRMEDIAASDIIVDVTGVARHPGDSREDLFPKNAKTSYDLIRQATKVSPESIVIVFTNPLDLMTEVALRACEFPRQRVFGAALADTIRLRTLVAQRLQISPSDVTTMVIGPHTEDCVPLLAYTSVGGIPISHFLSASDIEMLVVEMKNEGERLVLRTGRGAFIAPAIAGADLIESMALGTRRVVTCSVRLEGEYGLDNVSIGVPAIVGPLGIEEILKVPLTDQESVRLRKGADDIRNGIDRLVEPSLRRFQYGTMDL